jgi:hypothetical protein
VLDNACADLHQTLADGRELSRCQPERSGVVSITLSDTRSGRPADAPPKVVIPLTVTAATVRQIPVEMSLGEAPSAANVQQRWPMARPVRRKPNLVTVTLGRDGEEARETLIIHRLLVGDRLTRQVSGLTIERPESAHAIPRADTIFRTTISRASAANERLQEAING